MSTCAAAAATAPIARPTTFWAAPPRMSRWSPNRSRGRTSSNAPRMLRLTAPKYPRRERPRPARARGGSVTPGSAQLGDPVDAGVLRHALDQAAELGCLRGVELGPLVGLKQRDRALLRSRPGVQTSRLQPPARRVAVDHLRWNMLLEPEQLLRGLLLQELALERDPLEQLEREGLGPRLHAREEALGHRDRLGVDDELLGALAREEVEHARPGDHVDPRERADDRADAALHAGLRVHDLRVARAQVRVRRQAERLADLRIARVDHRGLDGAHRRRALAHVEDRGRAAPHDRRARF